MKARLGVTLVLIMVAAVAATDDLGGGVVENEETTTNKKATTEMLVTSTSAPHVHVRGSNGGAFNEEKDEEQETGPGVSSCDEGTPCWNDNDCTHWCGTVPLTCIGGICKRTPPDTTCREEGTRCREHYQCCGSLECEDSTCTRVTNENECIPSRGYCSEDYECCGKLACVNAKCASSTDCKKQGGYCEADYDCCDDLECGVSNHCVRFDIDCKALDEYCTDRGLSWDHCCDGFKCSKDSRCIKAGLHTCKLFGNVCRSDADCCGAGTMGCISGRCREKGSNDNCKHYGQACSYQIPCCEDEGLTCGRSNKCVYCRPEGFRCESSWECCGEMQCIQNICADVINPYNCIPRRCDRTADCCPGHNCRNNQCVDLYGQRGSGQGEDPPPIPNPPVNDCSGRSCLRTADCCLGWNCKSNQCVMLS